MRKVTTVHYEPPIRTLNGWDMRIAGEETKIEQEDCNMANNNLMSREKQIEEMAKATMKYCKTDNRCGSCHWSTCNECMSEFLYNAGYRKQSDVIDEFVERLKEATVKCALPLFGLTTKTEIEEYFDDIMLQVRDAIERIAKEMKGGAE